MKPFNGYKSHGFKLFILLFWDKVFSVKMFPGTNLSKVHYSRIKSMNNIHILEHIVAWRKFTILRDVHEIDFTLIRNTAGAGKFSGRMFAS